MSFAKMFKPNVTGARSFLLQREDTFNKDNFASKMEEIVFHDEELDEVIKGLMKKQTAQQRIVVYIKGLIANGAVTEVSEFSLVFIQYGYAYKISNGIGTKIHSFFVTEPGEEETPLQKEPMGFHSLIITLMKEAGFNCLPPVS